MSSVAYGVIAASSPILLNTYRLPRSLNTINISRVKSTPDDIQDKKKYPWTNSDFTVYMNGSYPPGYAPPAKRERPCFRCICRNRKLLYNSRETGRRKYPFGGKLAAVSGRRSNAAYSLICTVATFVACGRAALLTEYPEVSAVRWHTKQCSASLE